MTESIKLNIDRLEICYTADTETIEALKDTMYQELDGFRIKSIESNNNRETYLQIDIRNSEDWIKFGTIKMGSTFEEEERYIWLKVDNRMLYEPVYPTISAASYIYYIADTLRLSYNNITRLDIAIDSQRNLFNRTKRAIRNKELTPIVLGKAYENPKEIITKLLYIHTADRRRYRTGNISLSSSDKDAALCIYNKTEEIAESGKDYIAEWDAIKGTIYRTEVRLKRGAIKEYMVSRGKPSEEVYLYLQDKEILFDIFLFFSNRLLRFRKGREIFSILDL